MKRLILALAIFGCGTTALLALHRTTARLQRGVNRSAETLTSETHRLAQMRVQLTSLTKQVQDLKERVRLQEGIASNPESDVAEEISSGSAPLSPELSERLLARLGFNWAASGEYLVVSKGTLHAISLEGMRETKIGSAAGQVLAITPEERAGIETKTQQLMTDYHAWVESHVQRAEPSGDVVAKYSLSADPDFSLGLSNRFATTVLGTLGPERGNLLLNYSLSWMQDLGMGGTGGENSLKVTRYPASDEPRYSFELKYSGNTMTTDVSPYQPFPPAFLPLFPNGWPDLAKREGFLLPKAFQKQ